MKTSCWAAAHTSSSAVVVVVPYSDINRNGWKFNLRRRCVAQAPPTFLCLSLTQHQKYPNTWAEHKSASTYIWQSLSGQFLPRFLKHKIILELFSLFISLLEISLLRFGVFLSRFHEDERWVSWGEMPSTWDGSLSMWKKSSRIFVVGAQDRASSSSHPKHKLATN